MTEENIRNEISLIEFDKLKNSIIKEDFPLDSKYICRACSVCKTITKIHEGLCESCKKLLLQYEEYIYIKTYCEWLEKTAYEAHIEFNNVLMNIEKKHPELKNKEVKDIKKIIEYYRFSLENTTSYFVFREEINVIKSKYNINNINVLININEINNHK